MSKPLDVKPQSENELVLARILDIPPDKAYRAWTDTQLIPRFFVPRPWTISRVELDVRPGGSSFFVMKSPEGQEFPNSGVYLEVVPGRKLVFTNAFAKAWEPNTKDPFIWTCVLTFENEGGKTRYVARALHWTKEGRDQHEKMGFHDGWGIVADQLEDLMKSL